MGNGKKWSSPNPTAYDVASLHNCLFTDLGLYATTTVLRVDREHLQVVTRAYREVGGVKIGIAVYAEVCGSEQGDLTPLVYRTLLQCYWRAHDLAHTDPSGKGRYGKRR